MVPRQVFHAYEPPRVAAKLEYAFCPQCGETLSLVPGPGALQRCPRCRWVRYLNPLPGAVTLICDGSEVLLGKRGHDSYAPGLWCLPGGYIEFDEDFLSAAVREAREETGLEIEVTGIVSVVTNYLSDVLHTLVVVVQACVVSGIPAPGDDLVELAWFPLAGPLPSMAFEADQHIIERCAAGACPAIPVDPLFARGGR